MNGLAKDITNFFCKGILSISVIVGSYQLGNHDGYKEGYSSAKRIINPLVHDIISRDIGRGYTMDLRDIDRDGSFDSKTVYHREFGGIDSLSITVKDLYFKKYWNPLTAKSAKIIIVPDSTKLE